MNLFPPQAAMNYLDSNYLLGFLGTDPGPVGLFKFLAIGWLLPAARDFIDMLYRNIIGLFCMHASFTDDDYCHR